MLRLHMAIHDVAGGRVYQHYMRYSS